MLTTKDNLQKFAVGSLLHVVFTFPLLPALAKFGAWIIRPSGRPDNHEARAARPGPTRPRAARLRNHPVASTFKG